MANYHSHAYLYQQLQRHYDEACKVFPKERVIAIFANGSMNYGLEDKDSDMDTKVILAPAFKDFVYNKKPISATHVLENGEHMDFKDVRLWFQSLKKQNVNMLETLFTPYFGINRKYWDLWQLLHEKREEITRYDKVKAVQTMKGVAYDRYAAITRPTEHTQSLFDTYGYNTKSFSHVMRIHEFLCRYTAGESFEKCLYPQHPAILKDMKHGSVAATDAINLANNAMKEIDSIVEAYKANHKDDINIKVNKFLDDIQYEMVYMALYGKGLKNEN